MSMGFVYNLQNGKTMAKLTFFCSKCGVKCSGKLQILTAKLQTEPVCQHCFMETEMNTHLEESK
jgi:hypothetical protein